MGRYAVVMAGGSGERFWPLSRRQRPKQLLHLADPRRSLLQLAVEHACALAPPERVYIATGEPLREPIRAARVGVPDDNILAEPAKRNTAGCLAYATACLLARLPSERDFTLAVITADHVMQPADRVRATLERALRTAQERDTLVVVGIVPTHPETGYGYIERARDPSGDDDVLPVARFREKPDRAQAEAFLAAGGFYWNSGMFFWRVSVFLAELEAASPAHARAVQTMAEALRRGDEARVRELFAQLEDIPIDRALLERARNVHMVRADFDWDDVGTWDALDRIRPRDPDGNVAVGDPVLVDTRGCIVYNAPGAERMAVAAVGLENLIVVATEDGVLVAAKDRVQDVRRAVQALKERNAKQL